MSLKTCVTRPIEAVTTVWIEWFINGGAGAPSCACWEAPGPHPQLGTPGAWGACVWLERWAWLASSTAEYVRQTRRVIKAIQPKISRAEPGGLPDFRTVCLETVTGVRLPTKLTCCSRSVLVHDLSFCLHATLLLKCLHLFHSAQRESEALQGSDFTELLLDPGHHRKPLFNSDIFCRQFLHLPSCHIAWATESQSARATT